MANQNHLQLIKQGVEVWNKWRTNHPEEKPDLRAADLSHLKLRGINLSDGLLSKADLTETDLNGAALKDTQLLNTNLTKANLRGANLHGARLSGANLNGANLNESNLRRAHLSGADFSGSILIGAHLNEAHLSMAFLSGTDLTRASFIGADLSEADLHKAPLSEADLSKADLSRTNLKRSHLKGAQLNMANLIGAQLDEASLFEANISEAYLTGAKLRGTNLGRANLSDADLSEADLSHANLREADLSQADLRHATITGCKLHGTRRGNWKLSGIKCAFVLWDADGKSREPLKGEFGPGEFEKLYEESPRIQYNFTAPCSSLDMMIMEQTVNEINKETPGYELAIHTISPQPPAHVVFTLPHHRHADALLKKISALYETKVAGMAEYRKKVMETFQKIIGHPQILDQQEKTTPSAYAVADKDKLKAPPEKKLTIKKKKFRNQASKALFDEIDLAIQETSCNDAQREYIQEQLNKVVQELQQKRPNSTRLEMYWGSIVNIIPDIATVVPWNNMVQKALS